MLILGIVKIVAYTFFFFIGLTVCFAFLAYCRSEKRFNAVKPDGLDLTAQEWADEHKENLRIGA